MLKEKPLPDGEELRRRMAEKVAHAKNMIQ
jgi:hypothetical protein